MNKTLLPFVTVIMLLCGLQLQAQNQKIYLRDGSVFTGYISLQNLAVPDESEITYTSCERIFDREKCNTSNMPRPLDEWPDEWQKWANETRNFKKDGNVKTLTLTEVSGLPDESSAFYYVTQSGTDFFKAVKVTGGRFVFNVSNILCITNSRRDPALLNDLDDIVTTTRETYRGVIVEKYPGTQLKIWDSRDNRIYVVNQKDISSTGCDGFNKDYSIWQQSPYLVQFVSKSGTTDKGIIIKEALSTEGYLYFLTEDNREVKYTLDEYMKVTRIVRTVNEKASPMYDIILGENETRINRDSTLNFVEITSEEGTDGKAPYYYVRRDEAAKAISVVSGHVVIETSLADVEDVYVCKGRDFILNEGSRREENIPILYYTDADLIRSSVSVSYDESINGTRKLEFTLPESGTYFIYVKKLDKCWVVNYTEQVKDDKTKDTERESDKSSKSDKGKSSKVSKSSKSVKGSADSKKTSTKSGKGSKSSR